MKKTLAALLLLLAAAPCIAGTRPLKEDTAVTIVVGPFVDTAGAAVTAPTIASIDITAYKNDGTAVTITPAASGSSNDMVHVDDGYFSLELTTTDTSTPGYLRLTFQISGSLIFHEDFEVLPANIYDSRYSTDLLDVSVVQWTGTNVATPDTAGYPKVTIKDGTGTGEVNTNGGYVFSDLTKILGTTLAESSAGNLANNLKTFLDNGDGLTTARLDYITDIRGYTDTEVAAIKTKTDYLPSATAGASGGLLISGSNSGTTTLGALTVTGTTTMSDGLVVNRSSGNSHAVALTGSGIGNGLRITGGSGATGAALNIISGSTNGNAITATGTGIGAGAAFISGSGATGDGVSMTAASTNGNGLSLTRTGTGDDLYLANSDSATLANVVWNSLKASHTTPDSFGDYLDDEITSISAGSGVTAQEVWEYSTRNLSGTVNDFDELVSSASTFDTIVGSSTEWARATADVLNGTTIATLASQTSFTLTAGSTDNDAYNGGTAIFVDASTAVQKGVSVIDDYTGSTKTVTLASAPPFTIATSDKIYIVAPMGLPAATVTDVTSSGSVSAFLVDEDHTWTFASRSQTTSPQLVTELRGTDGFNGLVAMDFTVPMPANAVISAIGTVSVADESGKTEPTLSAASISPDKKKVHVPVNATSATAGTYTISVTITTTDSQTFMRKGRLVLE